MSRMLELWELRVPTLGLTRELWLQQMSLGITRDAAES